MADCILNSRRPHTPGEEGLQDHLLVEAIYKSASSNRPVSLPKVEGKDVTHGDPHLNRAKLGVLGSREFTGSDAQEKWLTELGLYQLDRESKLGPRKDGWSK